MTIYGLLTFCAVYALAVPRRGPALPPSSRVGSLTA
jgi:hypothetical protein